MPMAYIFVLLVGHVADKHLALSAAFRDLKMPYVHSSKYFIVRSCT